MGLKRKIIIFSVISIFLLYKNISRRKEDPKPSDLLQIVVDYTEYFELTKMKVMDSLQHTTLFEGLVRNHVKPSVDKLASLRSQTEKYEEMMRRSSSSLGAGSGGGPQQFMTSSLVALEEMHNQLLVWEKSYRMAILRIGRSYPGLVAQIEDVGQKINFLDSDKVFEPLDSFQIHFQLMDYDDPDRNEAVRKAKEEPLPISALLNIIKTTIIPSIKKFENYKIQNGLPPILDREKDLEGRDVTIILILKDLLPYIKKYGGQFNHFGEHWIKTYTELKEMSNSALEKSETAKTMYEALAAGIDSDILNLQERIRKLSSPKPKKEF
ncbi:uncharacterized protein LOC110842498 isoform X1 [Folsomia candida]|uniref:Uncharacterized protein n=1 Tax=Folsomia candida TaxID=158441 RepID=A0A226EWJ6_FOLCA|nr:uncharacterized protein LOC110842498 isoform X1 [Folsomia candida]OXA61548.1 hypothetical protein Fcan01_03359 [Folsomia candida]